MSNCTNFYACTCDPAHYHYCHVLDDNKCVDPTCKLSSIYTLGLDSSTLEHVKVAHPTYLDSFKTLKSSRKPRSGNVEPGTSWDTDPEGTKADRPTGNRVVKPTVRQAGKPTVKPTVRQAGKPTTERPRAKPVEHTYSCLDANGNPMKCNIIFPDGCSEKARNCAAGYMSKTRVYLNANIQHTCSHSVAVVDSKGVPTFTSDQNGTVYQRVACGQPAKSIEYVFGDAKFHAVLCSKHQIEMAETALKHAKDTAPKAVSKAESEGNAAIQALRVKHADARKDRKVALDKERQKVDEARKTAGLAKQEADELAIKRDDATDAWDDAVNKKSAASNALSARPDDDDLKNAVKAAADESEKAKAAADDAKAKKDAAGKAALNAARLLAEAEAALRKLEADALDQSEAEQQEVDDANATLEKAKEAANSAVATAEAALNALNALKALKAPTKA